MKIVLLTSDYNISSNIGLKAFLESAAVQKGQVEVAGIVAGNQFNFSSRGLERTARYFKKMDIPFLMKNILMNIWKQLKILAGRHIFKKGTRKYYGLKEMAELNDIPFLRVNSVNSQEAAAFINQINPDILVSCFLLEIVKKDILSIPKQGSINIHPALFQHHRGTFSSFWAILKGWRKSGATVHYMTENIDDGEIILQKHFFVHPSDTVHSVNEKAAKLGGKLLAKALLKIKKNQVKAFRPKKMGKLFTFPSQEEIDAFYSKGKMLISLKEFFTL